MVEWGTEAHVPNARFVSLPVQSLSIANVLNGRADTKGFTESSDIIRFTIPHAQLLVVDDISTNLKVAEGLLAPYHAQVDTCLSGVQAIEMVKRKSYDLVFMDHMMPEMDGVEATALIRAWEAELEAQGVVRFAVPIVALTANAVMGMKEMFIEKGFSDFLAKPIDVSKMDEILNRWIPKEKRKTRVVNNGHWSAGSEDRRSSDRRSGDRRSGNNEIQSPLIIPGVDTAKGITMTGGTLSAYKQVLAMFRTDAQERLPLLRNTPDAGTLPAFVIHVHALKSASASLGAAEVSNEAAQLEAAGKAGDMAFIQEHLSGFARQLTELIEGISAVLKEDSAPDASPSGIAAVSLSVSELNDLGEALRSHNASAIDRLLDELSQKPLDAKTRAAVDRISDDVLMAEFDSALKTINDLLDDK
jgi:CheY-like chemotaxis protein